MGSEKSTAFDDLSEQAKLMNLALYYTNGNTERAKKMITGQFNDLYVLKAMFSSSTSYGAFILFYNDSYLKIVNLFSLLTPVYDIQNLKTSLNWNLFEKDLVEAKEKHEKDPVLTNQMQEILNEGIDISYLKELNQMLGQDDHISLNHAFQRLLSERLGLQRVDISLDYEKISSLDLEKFSLTAKKVNQIELAQKNAEKEKEAKRQEALAKLKEKEKDEEPVAGKDGVKLILKGGLILSPVKGKHISNVIPGDRIQISIIDKNPKAMIVLKALKAYDEENERVKPVVGRVKSIRYYEGEGYKLYIIIAAGILVQIFEEETNIKIALDPLEAKKNKNNNEAAELKKKSAGKYVAIGISVAVAIIVVILLFLFLL